MERIRQTSSIARQRGFTLVELMVGVLVGLLATVVMFQMFAVSEGQKRTTTGAGDAQQNGVFSLFQLERDGRMAGYGINHVTLMGCTTNGYYEPGGVGFNFRMLPVQIANGTGGAPDQITFLYGSSDMYQAPVKFINNPGATGFLQVDNRFGFQKGDLVVLAQESTPCTLAQVRDLPSPAGDLDKILRTTGSYIDASGNSRTTMYNPAGGVPPMTTYTKFIDAAQTGARLYNLGSRPMLQTYRINNNALEVVDGLVPGGAPTVIADGVVQMQAQYGYDGSGDYNIISTGTGAAVSVPEAAMSTTDQWADAMPATATAANWARVIAIRLAVVSRSMTPEKPDSSGTCITTTANPVWVSKGNVAMDIAGSNAQWGCYRYRTFEVIVPLRNMIWWPQ
ncbi:hypothetical protein DSM104440_03251 [Usitatibacter palustris]|uniref:Type IV pilus assembly protein PilW n=2 Tax=Usitatibacter palustris TaxID=2732487 RepID=A0A6M4HEJ5_9PROT|nr:hypothetical protein DSM104440_03251 [Usitatibacter palustris]